MSRPVWLPASPHALVIADGRLYAVSSGGAVANTTPSQGVVTAFSVAPDGRRIALIINGQPYLASVVHTTDGMAVGSQMSRIDAGGLETGSLTAVAWSRLERVVLGGRLPTGYGLVEVTTDGALASTLKLNLNSPITHLVAYPPLPSASLGVGKIMGQTGGGTGAFPFEYTSSGFQALHAISEPGTPSPSPSATTVPLTPSAPFFVD
jgi:hypothetical protein